MTAPATFATPTPMALRCPKCAAEMTTYERSGVILDQCRECRGIYLDRGELERIVDAEARPVAASAPVAPQPAPYRPDDRSRGEDRYRGDDRRPERWDTRGYRSDWDGDDDDDDRRRFGGWDDDRGGRPRKKRSLFGELLESFGD